MPSDRQVQILAASIRSVDHLSAAFAFGADLVTVAAKVLEEWVAEEFPLPGSDLSYKEKTLDDRSLKPLPYNSLNLDQSWENFDLTPKVARCCSIFIEWGKTYPKTPTQSASLRSS